MKPLAFFVVGIIVVFGVFAIVLNVVRSTERVFVVVDSSFPMGPVWDQVPSELDDIDGSSYSEFALATEKALVHTWQDRLELGGVTPFAPCGFDGIEDHPEASDADELVIITTPASCPTEAFTEWRVIMLQP